MTVTNDLHAELSVSSDIAAKRLLGCHIVREFKQIKLIGKIVETEAYDQLDAASHSYRGITNRTKVMFGSPAHLYVYFTYGMHYCCNVVCGPTGHGAAVLIRAIEPLQGFSIMMRNRQGKSGLDVTNGPAKVCQAFAIDMKLNGHDLHAPPIRLVLKPSLSDQQITRTTRIGISKAKDELLRFYITHNKYVSRPL